MLQGRAARLHRQAHLLVGRPEPGRPQIEHEINDEFWAAFAKTYPNITVDKQNLDYNEMLNKLRTAALGNAAPMVAKLPILWGVEFAAKGQLEELSPRTSATPPTISGRAP